MKFETAIWDKEGWNLEQYHEADGVMVVRRLADKGKERLEE